MTVSGTITLSNSKYMQNYYHPLYLFCTCYWLFSSISNTSPHILSRLSAQWYWLKMAWNYIRSRVWCFALLTFQVNWIPNWSILVEKITVYYQAYVRITRLLKHANKKYRNRNKTNFDMIYLDINDFKSFYLLTYYDTKLSIVLY